MRPTTPQANTPQALDKLFSEINELAEKKQEREQLLQWLNPMLSPAGLRDKFNSSEASTKINNLYHYLKKVLGDDPTEAKEAAGNLLEIARGYEVSPSIQERNKYLAWGGGLSVGSALALIILFSLPPIHSGVALGLFVTTYMLAISAAIVGGGFLIFGAVSAVTAEKGPRECIQAIAKASIEKSTPSVGEKVLLWASETKQATLKKVASVSAYVQVNPDSGL